MRTLILATAVFLFVPALRAQQEETKESQPQPAAQTVPQETSDNSNAQNALPAAIRPGHPLDPADVDVLTGKKDREIEAARRANVQVIAGSYGAYGDFYATNGWRGAMFGSPLLPLTRISNPFLFSIIQPRGFGRGGFRGRR